MFSGVNEIKIFCVIVRTFVKDDDFLRSVLKYEICVWRFRVEHGERELVEHLLPVELLGVFEQVDERLDILPEYKHLSRGVHPPRARGRL